jgi:hypothetical protein
MRWFGWFRPREVIEDHIVNVPMPILIRQVIYD